MKAQYIADLLYYHECVIVPGLGGFLTSYLPARVDRVNNRFFPPSCSVAFNAELTANDGLLANHIVSGTSVTYREAMEEIRRWVEHSLKDLRSGKPLVLADIGTLRLNESGALQFEPASRVNYLGNSFGLPTFIAHPVPSRNPETSRHKIPVISGHPSKVRYLVKESLKWAAILAPFIAFTLWGSMNAGRISDFLQNNSALYSWVWDKSEDKPSVQPAYETVTIPVENKTAPQTEVVSVMQDSAATMETSQIPTESVKANTMETSLEAKGLGINKGNLNYYIVGGAFRDYNNAENMVLSLREKGYPAMIIDTTAKGLFVVSIEGYVSRKEAALKLPLLREAGYDGAWVMRKG